jgi:hypothetical protein
MLCTCLRAQDHYIRSIFQSQCTAEFRIAVFREGRACPADRTIMARMQPGVFINITDVKGFRGYFPEQRCVDGKNFMQLSKRDRGLARAVLGRAICTSETHGDKVDMNLAFFDEAVDLRTKAFTDELVVVLQDTDEHADGDAPQKKKRKVALTKNSQSILSPHLPITFPTATLNDASVEMPKKLNVLFGYGLTDVWIEMNDDNFNYVVKRLKSDMHKASKGRTHTKKSNSEASGAVMETPKKTRRPAGDV